MLLDQKRTVDPRDNLDKAHRRELVEFARANGLEVSEDMPADDIEGKPGTGLRNFLRAKGVTRIAIPRRSIDGRGTEKTFSLKARKPAPPLATSDEWNEFQQFKAWKASQHGQAAPAAPIPVASDKSVEAMSINELRDACKTRGIKMERRDNMASLKAKLNGENAS
jgi:hypothetical protein